MDFYTMRLGLRDLNLGGLLRHRVKRILLGRTPKEGLAQTQGRPGTDPGASGRGVREETRTGLREGRPDGRGPQMLTEGRIH